jgi:hypothetical protein
MRLRILRNSVIVKGAPIDEFASLTYEIRYRACFNAKSLRMQEASVGQDLLSSVDLPWAWVTDEQYGEVTLRKIAISAPLWITTLVQNPAKIGV